MKLGLAAPLPFMIPHHGIATPPPAPAPMVRAVPATGPPLSAGVRLPPVTPKAPVPVDPINATTTTTTTAAPVPSVCTVRWAALPATDPVTGQTGAYPATFVGSCAEAYAYAQVGGGVVSQGTP
jgi:hypothetical protein